MRLFACLIVAPQRGYDEPAILSYAISSFCPTSADGLQLGLCSFSCTATSRHGSGRAALSTRVAVRSPICGPSTTSWPSTHAPPPAFSADGEGGRKSPERLAMAVRNLWLLGIWLELLKKIIPFHDRCKEVHRRAHQCSCSGTVPRTLVA